jgi:hypothetical protein
MSELYLLFVVALYAATVVATLACASVGRSRPEAKERRLAKVCRGLGIAVAATGVVGAVSGMVLSNVLLALVVAIPALLVARRSLRPRALSS